MSNLGFNVKSTNYYNQTLLENEAVKLLESLYQEYSHGNFYLILDETTDTSKRSILNILIGSLDLYTYEKPKIIYSGEIINTKSDIILTVLELILNNLTSLIS